MSYTLEKLGIEAITGRSPELEAKGAVTCERRLVDPWVGRLTEEQVRCLVDSQPIGVTEYRGEICLMYGDLTLQRLRTWQSVNGRSLGKLPVHYHHKARPAERQGHAALELLLPRYNAPRQTAFLFELVRLYEAYPDLFMTCFDDFTFEDVFRSVGSKPKQKDDYKAFLMRSAGKSGPPAVTGEADAADGEWRFSQEVPHE